MLSMSTRRDGRGFTLIEILVVVAVVAILTVIAVPNFSVQLRNTQIRTAAEQLQNDLRNAQAQAISQNRSVEFVLASTAYNPAAAAPAPAAANANVNYWYAQTIPLLAGDVAQMVAFGSTGGAGANLAAIQIVNPTANPVCFSSSGRLTAISPSPGVTCQAPGNIAYLVQSSSATPANYLQLDVTVKPGGQVRLCNPVHANTPDACT